MEDKRLIPVEKGMSRKKVTKNMLALLVLMTALAFVYFQFSDDITPPRAAAYDELAKEFARCLENHDYAKAYGCLTNADGPLLSQEMFVAAMVAMDEQRGKIGKASASVISGGSLARREATLTVERGGRKHAQKLVLEETGEPGKPDWRVDAKESGFTMEYTLTLKGMNEKAEAAVNGTALAFKDRTAKFTSFVSPRLAAVVSAPYHKDATVVLSDEKPSAEVLLNVTPELQAELEKVVNAFYEARIKAQKELNIDHFKGIIKEDYNPGGKSTLWEWLSSEFFARRYGKNIKLVSARFSPAYFKGSVPSLEVQEKWEDDYPNVIDLWKKQSPIYRFEFDGSKWLIVGIDGFVL
ncbi:MAG: hypothetical protein NUV48_14065 [Peptococcaceae bacterium]|nr:hypothetical protein [Peptococcaceae bacterium]